MKKKVSLIVNALLVAACAVGWTGLSHAENQGSYGQRSDRSENLNRDSMSSSEATIDLSSENVTSPSNMAAVSLPAGVKAKDNPAAQEAIRDVYRTLVNAAAAGDLNKVVEQFAAPDRDRIESYAQKVPEDFMGVVKGFGNLWETRFGSAFNVVDRNVFGAPFLSIGTGEISDPAALTTWPLKPTPQYTVPSEQGERSKLTGRDYLAKGRDVAVVVLPATENLPELTVSMTHEAPDFWKIDIPDNIDGPTLRSNLEQHINAMTAGQAQWPPQSEEGYRMAAHHILMAIYGVPPTGAAGTHSGAPSTSSHTEDSHME